MVDPERAWIPAAPPLGQVLGVVATGGVIGSLARYQVGRWWPARANGFPASTLSINLLGCLVIGVFLLLITERLTPHPLLRPFVGTGVLGGFTTFSTYALDIRQLLTHGRLVTALLYLGTTAVGAVMAAAIGVVGARRIIAHRNL